MKNSYPSKKISSKLLFLMVLFLWISIKVFGQKQKLSMWISYTPNLSNITTQAAFGKPKLSHIGAIGLAYKINKHISPTLGIGWMNTGQRRESIVMRPLGDTQITARDHYQYLIVPIGVKFHLGTFFIQSEIGFAYYFSNKIKVTSIDENGIKTKETKSVIIQGDTAFNQWTIPAFLTIGKTFSLKQLKVETGLKGYYGLDPILVNTTANSVKSKYLRYVGLGLFFGIRI